MIHRRMLDWNHASKTLAVTAAIVLVAVVMCLLAVSSGVAAVTRSAATSCTPAPYYMIHNGDFTSSRKGMGTIKYKRWNIGGIGSSYYRPFWQVNKGFAICKVTVSYAGHPAARVASGLQSGHWDLTRDSAGQVTVRGRMTVKVYVRKALA